MKKIKQIIAIQLVIIIYSFSSFVSKLASKEVFLSTRFCLFYGLMILVLGIYAVLWQQILKRTSLTIAYINKASDIIWCSLLGLLFFREQITLNNVLGIIVVIIGIVIIVYGDMKNE